MTGQSYETGGKLRFGTFEADVRTGELRKSGVRIKVQSQPFKLLIALLERPGQLVTREDLRQFIWGSETAVDFDHSLGTAVNKLREALGDSADSPRYIETLAKRGYRFIAPVQLIEPPVTLRAPVEERAPEKVLESAPPIARTQRNWARLVLGAGLVLMAAAGASLALISGWQPQRPSVRFSKVTWSHSIFPGDISIERFPGLATDGLRIYFSEIRGGKVGLSQASVGEGETHLIPTPPEVTRPALADISPDGTKLLIRSMTWSEMEQPLWISPVMGGAARKVLSGLAHDATWLPDGKSILYASGRDLLITQNDGREPRQLATLPGRAFWIRYSPDGSRIRFTLLDATTRATSLWELSPDGKGLHQLLSGWNNPSTECCGNWTPDGKYYVFQSTRDGVSNIWARRESRSFWPGSQELIQVTSGPLSYIAPSPSRIGNRMFVIGAHTRSQLSRFDSKSREFVRYLPNINTAGRTELSPDSSQVAWISTADGTLWRSRIDGTQRLQLTSHPMQVFLMRWSPDGGRIAFMGKQPGVPWKVYVISADGGTPHPLDEQTRSQADPDWSADGNSIVFGRPPDYMSEDSTQKAIYVFDVKTRKASTVAGSNGLFSPRWSPDGRFIAAMPLNQRKLMVFDIAGQKWSEVATKSVNNPVWSRDGKYIYFQAYLEDARPIYRVAVQGREVELVTDFKGLEPADIVDYWGITANNELIVSLRFFTADVYAVEWDRP